MVVHRSHSGYYYSYFVFSLTKKKKDVCDSPASASSPGPIEGGQGGVNDKPCGVGAIL